MAASNAKPKAGDLRHRISVGRTATTTNENGYPVETDTFICRVWASARDAGYREFFEAAAGNLQVIDEKLESCSENWKVSRMAKVDLAILRLSAAEILYLDDVPDSASINEAVDMAKKFGGDDSGKFINGILGKVVRSKDAE